MEELIQAYTNLLEIQYNGLPNAVKTVKLHCNTLFANKLLWQIRDAFDIETATGKQLDIIGLWVGVDRFYKGQNFDNQLWLAYFDWSDATQPNQYQGCYKDWNNETTDDGAYISYYDIASTTNRLDDEQFRLLIKLKIAKNNIINTNKNIDDAINRIFNDNVYTTWGVMEITYNYDYTMYNIIKLAESKNCLLAPTGCKIILNEV